MNEIAVLGQVKFLYEHELYSNIVSLSSSLSSTLDKGNDVATSSTKFQLMVYFANSLCQCKEYKRAESTFRAALQLRKSLGKMRGKQDSNQEALLSPEMDLNNIKYQIHLCHANLKQYTQAIAVLESIPAKLRTCQVNMALGKLYQQSGQDRSSITAYKEVVKECPLALEAARGLLSLGVKGAEVSSMVLNGSSISSIDWVPLWIKAYAQLYSREYSSCVGTIKLLETKTTLANNIDILKLQGEAYYYNGDYKLAENVLERVHTIDPHYLSGMDLYALLLAKENKVKELESLSTHLLSITEESPEPWLSMALYCQITGKITRAVYFAQKACVINPRNVEALLLKGFILIDIKKLQEAAFHFREALKIAPYRYEPHKGLVECHLAMGRNKEAMTLATHACKQLGNSARSFTLYANVLAKDPSTKDRARSFLEKALKVDNTHLPAVYKLVEIYEQDKEIEKGIELVTKQLEIQSNGKLHQLLADLLYRNKDSVRALDHYGIALSFEPNNPRVLQGMQRVEQQSDLADSSYDIDDLADTDNEEGVESEVEGVWSDVDFT
ncbi:Anaphase-promoting complex subunit 7 [Nymphon striatum]|nr:Anaphase-promoting complex subunit 7 [Nymphon striatum]